MGGIRCARCGSDNAAGSRFCGVCGVRLGTVPPTEPRAGSEGDAGWAPQVTAARVRATRETPDVSAAERATSAPTSPASADRPWTPPPAPPDDGAADDRDRRRASLDGSLQLPSRSGSRAVAIALILAIDAALVIAGVFLWREAPVAIAGDAGAAAIIVDAADGPAVTAIDAGATAGGAAVPAPPRSGGGRLPSSPGPGGAGDSTVPADARSLDDLLGRRDAAAEPVPAVPTSIDAALPADAAAPDPIDAPGPLDPYEREPADAGADSEPVDEEPEAAVVDAADAVARLTSRNQQRFQRCYRQAAKAYTPEQPLEGEVDIALRVMPTGDVHEVSAVRNTTGSESLAQCLVAIIAGWRVAAAGAEPIDMVRPFRFGSSP